VPQMSAGKGPHVLRELNAAAVLTALRGHGPARVADLVGATGLSRPAVSRALDALRDAGWIADADPADPPDTSRLGRPAQLVRFRAEAGYVLGIDVGPHKVLALLADLAGTVVAERRTATHRLTGAGPVLDAVRRTVSEVLAEAGIPPDAVVSTTVGTPGLVDPDTGAVRLAPSIPGWAGLPIATELRGTVSGPLHLDNDVNLAVLAERWRGAAADADTLLFVQWGARLGAGILIGGHLHRGAAAAAGEIGFLNLADEGGAGEGRQGDDGAGDGPGGAPGATMGPFEREVGASALIEAALAEAEERGDAGLLEQLRPARDTGDAAPLFAAARAGNLAAVAAIDRVAMRLARGLAAACLVLDPDLIVLGGGVSRAGDTVLAAVERHLRARTLVPPRLALSALGDTAVALGAVRSALDDVDRRLLTGNPLAPR
jgi:predicted NBD/HSP70 family sugar kinase